MTFFEKRSRLLSYLVEFLWFLREVCACFKGTNMVLIKVFSEEDRSLPCYVFTV